MGQYSDESYGRGNGRQFKGPLEVGTDEFIGIPIYSHCEYREGGY